MKLMASTFIRHLSDINRLSVDELELCPIYVFPASGKVYPGLENLNNKG